MYPPLDTTTVPLAAAFIDVPFGAPISMPLCDDPHLLPNLDVIVPDTGFIKSIPMFVDFFVLTSVFVFDIFVVVLFRVDNC